MNSGSLNPHRTLSNIQQQINIKYNCNKHKLGKYNLLHLNINSLRNKLDELEFNIEQLQNAHGKIIHLIALAETRININDAPYYNLHNYISFHCTRDDGYGGCALFVHNSLTCNLTQKKSESNIELLTVNVIELALNITVVYKQPQVNGEFFIQTLNSFIENKGKMIVVGDTNINLLGGAGLVNRYIDSLLSIGYTILNRVDEKFATRVAHRTYNQQNTITKTIIDHAIANCLDFSYVFSIVDSPISDHKELLIAFDDKKNVNFLCTEKTFSYNKIDERKITVELSRLVANATNEPLSDMNDFVTRLEIIKSNSTTQKT